MHYLPITSVHSRESLRMAMHPDECIFYYLDISCGPPWHTVGRLQALTAVSSVPDYLPAVTRQYHKRQAAHIVTKDLQRLLSCRLRSSQTLCTHLLCCIWVQRRGHWAPEDRSKSHELPDIPLQAHIQSQLLPTG